MSESSDITKSASEVIKGTNAQRGEFASRWRQVRACARCHRLKMRCSYDDPSCKSCKRCFAIGVECSLDEDPTAQFAKKKRRRCETRKLNENNPSSISQIKQLLKITKTSLSVIENELKHADVDENKLRSLCTNFLSTTSKFSMILDNSEEVDQSHNRLGGDLKFPQIEYESNLMEELIFKYKLISLEECKIRFNFFLNKMLPYYPIISLSKNLKDFDYLIKHHPLLLAAYISVTAINDNELSASNLIESSDLSNESLFRLLIYYIESFVSYHVYIKSEDLTFHLIYICLILSLWCLPPKKFGHFKNHLNLLMGYNVSLCIDSSAITKYNNLKYNDLLFDDNSNERNGLRAFLSVYCCCGSLGLSLPRFKLVSWSKNHEVAIEALLWKAKDLPTSNDRYICYFAKMICLSQDIFEFLSSNGLITALGISNGDSTSISRLDVDPLIQKMWVPTALSLSSAKYVVNNYEQKLYSTLLESGFMKTKSGEEFQSNDDLPKERYLLSIIYYQLLMTIYDNLITGYLHHQKDVSVNDVLAPFDLTERLYYFQHIVKLMKICENILNTFMKLNIEQTINYPTFFYYRPLHALILLIRLRLLVKSQNLLAVDGFKGSNDINIDIEYYFKEISKIIQRNRMNFNSRVSSKMSVILDKISKWMNVSYNYKCSSFAHKEEHISLSLVNLMNMSKDQEIEKLKAPKENNDLIPEKQKTEIRSMVNESIDPGSPLESISTSQPMNFSHAILTTDNDTPETPNQQHISQETIESSSIQEIFKEIDMDIVNYLNSLESTFDFNSLKNFSLDKELNAGSDISVDSKDYNSNFVPNESFGSSNDESVIHNLDLYNSFP